MGKVTITIESKDIPTKVLEASCHSMFDNEADYYLGDIPDDVEVFIVPSDEED